MSLEVIRQQPEESSFTPLSTHQEATPDSFYTSKPVLHYQSSCSLQLPLSSLSHPAFAALVGTSTNGTSTSTSTNSGEHTTAAVEAYITSANLLLWNASSQTGLSIAYPLISLHAQQGKSIYMQLMLSDAKNTADEDLETLELHLTPKEATAQNTSEHGAGDQVTNGLGAAATQSPAQKLYIALSACADLHPDPSSDDENAGQNDVAAEMGMATPGAGGWITADNMAEYMDEDGNFRMPERGRLGAVDGEQEIGDEGQEEGLERTLGMGAGRVRRAEEFADVEDDDESKWQRTG